MVTLVASVKNWLRDGKQVMYENLEACGCAKYLQRMDFFEASGVALEESFSRRDGKGKFVEIKRIDSGTSVDIEGLSTAIASCIFPELADSVDLEATGPFDIVQYATSELALNVRQHSKGVGYVTAQVYPQTGIVRIAISDSGIGIRQSFEETLPPGWVENGTDLDALLYALQPKASSKAHMNAGWSGGAVNAGVGLSILHELAKCTGGVFTLASGNALHQIDAIRGKTRVTNSSFEGSFSGTICSLELARPKLSNHQAILHKVKISLGLLGSRSDVDFNDLFT
jgi:hypothetical protein